MSASKSSTEVARIEKVIRYNIRRYCRLLNRSQNSLAPAIGVTSGAVSQMMTGTSELKFGKVYLIAKELGVSIDDLMDDTYLCQDEELVSKLSINSENEKAEAGPTKPTAYGVHAEKPGALVGAGSPRFLVSPFNPDAPIEGRISGAAKGALAGFVPSGVPSGSSSPSMPSKHDGIGVPGRSQAHETLGTMTTIIMRTSEGDITINLFDDQTPVTVKNFLGLATGEKEWTDPFTGQPSHEPFYNGLTFHRIIKDFMIQGGCPLGNGTGGPGYDFDDEIVPELTFDRPYLLAMANAGLRRGRDGKAHGTNGSQFFITTVPTPWLDGHHTIFGEVANDESKAVVDKLEAVPTDRSDAPLEPAGIMSIEVVK
ncbi:helix-turn-helix domain-containing protein [Bifidobacterium bifidum]|uniref:peptidylprolyl isomerase n=3 Tax=Bifidobacterium bifidum TaxID=1681 RepID=A0A415C8P5_BIFBI|nr:helix-turn-helix domain-containing protein [Bifidobacterium bifidum]RHJ25035.1 helix-turn-helix domain-containing protein [Bifidobacterium bifidum]